ncbi:hypothetical protein HPB48_011068 [Haemaphysalis longicornis]|uniref:Uncharacterized protein n=1 Tax=Haemaphysalis longicornis TaxID=44386 RepID=A0A9J6GRK2_HAELO|nr:hypothetical protein HPB48_011068 [Haemaphysalis longicornis]
MPDIHRDGPPSRTVPAVLQHRVLPQELQNGLVPRVPLRRAKQRAPARPQLEEFMDADDIAAMMNPTDPEETASAAGTSRDSPPDLSLLKGHLDVAWQNIATNPRV